MKKNTLYKIAISIASLTLFIGCTNTIEINSTTRTYIPLDLNYGSCSISYRLTNDQSNSLETVVSGYVFDFRTKLPIENVNIVLCDCYHQKLATKTDLDGFFTLQYFPKKDLSNTKNIIGVIAQKEGAKEWPLIELINDSIMWRKIGIETPTKYYAAMTGIVEFESNVHCSEINYKMRITMNDESNE